MPSKAPLIAAIDVGTNSFHMVIASVNHRGMLQIHMRERESVRLGTGSSDMKYIQADAMDRGIRTLEQFAGIAHAENAELRAIATSAVREALNRDEFLEKVREKTGIEIEVVSGAEEGRLIYTGAIHALPLHSQRALVIDIGGGSTETVVGYEGEIRFIHSAKLGAIRLTKRFFDNGKATKEQIAQCRDYIRGDWSPILKRISERGFDIAVGTAGTITSLAVMSLAARKERIPDILNGLTVSRQEMLDVIGRITDAKDLRQRVDLPGMDPQRADIILAGSLIIEHAINELNIQKLTISSYALREGIVFDTVQKKQAIQRFHHLSSLRYESVLSICNQYRVNLNHAEHIKRLSLKMFDTLKPFHKLGYAERELLEASALLHDVGYHISHDQHHKHSYYIISNCFMPGFTNDEAEVIANVARYHRKSHPKKKHENFLRLSFMKQRVVKILSGILRIAEGIDRRQFLAVRDIDIELNEKDINITLIPASDEIKPDIELWGANRRKMLLEEALNRKISFRIEEEAITK